MRLLFVVQRYGREVAGGAELACRLTATHLTARGHEVHVLTSRARSYVDWADHYPAGDEEVDGVVVHRLGVDRPRDDRRFGELNRRAAYGPTPAALPLQREWMRAQGPSLPGLGPWLAREAAGFDVAGFWTYLYRTTADGLPVAAAHTPTVLHPTAHDEPPLRLALFDRLVRRADALVCLTPEEQALLRGRFGRLRHTAVVGLGTDLDPPVGDPAAFRARHGLGDAPYLVCVGRIDPAKGTDELTSFFAAHKAARPGPLKLVLVGEPVRPLPPHPDVILTGWVDEAERRAAVAGALALVQPSYFESFSLVLVEAWAQGAAALVQGRCAVLAGHARRSGGALPYEGYAQFSAAVDWLQEDPGLAARLGAAGRAYVERECDWDRLVDRYERLLRVVATRSPRAVSRGGVRLTWAAPTGA
ncbi:MAG TPA: glycosyltransferase family 4 protein [Acidimicrobiales bacterium]